MKITPTELSIRASWSLNCAVANLKQVGCTPANQKQLYDEALKFLGLLDMVKAYIDPPLKEGIVGKGVAEKKDVKEGIRDDEMRAVAEDENALQF